MDAPTRAGQTAGMGTKTKSTEELLAEARDITMRTMGDMPSNVVAEVFRQLCLEREYGAVSALEQTSSFH